MFGFDITITGDAAVLAKLAALARLDGVEAILNDEADTIIALGQDYPPERPGQKYVRTFDIRDSYRKEPVKRSGQAIEITIVNESEHAEPVIGRDQAPIHQGRWKKLKTIGEERLSVIRTAVQAAVVKSWRH